MLRSTVIACAIVLIVGIPALAQQAGWLGLTIEDQKDAGAVIRNVEPNSPAAKAGLKTGDLIVEYNKENVAGAQQLTRLVRETPVGRTVEMKVRRDSGQQTVQVTTEASRFPEPFNFQFNTPDLRVFMDKADQIKRNIPHVEVSTTFVQSGIRVEQLTDQLRDFFGVSGNAGVLVGSVESGSSAEKAGLKAGDVVIAIDGKTVRTPADFSREMRDANGKAALKVVRDKQQREFKLD